MALSDTRVRGRSECCDAPIRLSRMGDTTWNECGDCGAVL